eukprot:633575-Prymnesium_polylepis.1
MRTVRFIQQLYGPFMATQIPLCVPRQPPAATCGPTVARCNHASGATNRCVLSHDNDQPEA